MLLGGRHRRRKRAEPLDPDQEVAVEVRFISIAEGFYERIGVDFNINIPTGNATSSTGSLLAGGNFTNGQFPNVFDPKSFLTGFTPAGTFTPDLDIPIKNSSFGMAIPPFVVSDIGNTVRGPLP